MRKTLALAILILLAAAAPARAGALLPPTLDVINAPCPDPTEHVNGCAYPNGTVYFDETNKWANPFDRAHEIGHAFDFEILSGYDHARFAQLINVYGDWDGPNIDRHGGPAGPLREDFADAYAGCLLHVNPSEDSGYGYEPSNRRQARVCAWIKRLRQVRVRQ